MELKMRQVIFLNGKFISPQEAKVSLLDPGILYGEGLFETMRAYHGRIVYLNAHLQRIQEASEVLDIKSNVKLQRLKEVIRQTVKKNNLKDAYVRLTLWKQLQGCGVMVLAKKYDPPDDRARKRGFALTVSPYFQGGSFFSRFKTLNRLFYELSFSYAKNKGFDEAVILNQRGYITECSRSNIFFVSGKELFTPALECGCLDGITRRVIFDLCAKHNVRINTGDYTVRDLCSAQEVFLTNSLLGVMPVFSVQDGPVGQGKIGRLTQFFLRQHEALLKV